MHKRVVWVSFVSALLLTVVYGLNKSLNYGSFKDSRDGQTYKTIKIGEQTWMAENMNYEMPDSYCYGDKALNCVNYGRLYSLKSANEVCPAGWRLPTSLDWSVLIFSIGGESVAGKYAAVLVYFRVFPHGFDLVIGNSPAIRRKPAPDMVLAILEKLSISREDALYIGDTETDLETAANAGVKCLAVDWGFRTVQFLKDHGAETIIHDPEEILSYV